VNKDSVDQLHLSNNQCKTLYSALKHYEEYLNQPNEMAEDHTQKRQEIKELLNYFSKNSSLGVKRYKLVDNKWVLLT